MAGFSCFSCFIEFRLIKYIKHMLCKYVINAIMCIMLSKRLLALQFCLFVYVQVVRSAASDVWAACPGPRSSPPSSYIWA